MHLVSLQVQFPRNRTKSPKRRDSALETTVGNYNRAYGLLLKKKNKTKKVTHKRAKAHSAQHTDTHSLSLWSTSMEYERIHKVQVRALHPLSSLILSITNWKRLWIDTVIFFNIYNILSSSKILLNLNFS